jgi:ribosomal protein L37AE/L43A
LNPTREPTAWLLLAVARGERQHGGNDGYDDAVQRYYSWDSTVPNHGKITIGDVAVIWDKVTVLGASRVSDIVHGHATKFRRSCPQCGMASLKARKSKLPLWKCFKCGECFDKPVEEPARVTTYRGYYVDDWIGLVGVVSAAEARAACRDPKSQLSLRQLNWSAFLRTVERGGGPLEHVAALVPRS